MGFIPGSRQPGHRETATRDGMTKPPRRAFAIGVMALLTVAWLALLTLPPTVLITSRTAWLVALERPEAQARWDEYRDAMRAQSGRQGPVQRKIPKSPEPPLRVWLRDYVWLAICAWLVLAGALGLFTLLLVAGALGLRAAQRPNGRGSAAP